MKKILIVEDEELLSKIMRDALEKSGYQIINSYNGRTTVDLLKKQKVELILLDIKLPDVDGVVLINEIKPIAPETPIIVCSAYDSFRLEYEKWKDKVSDYITKPIILKELKEKVKKLVEK